MIRQKHKCLLVLLLFIATLAAWWICSILSLKSKGNEMRSKYASLISSLEKAAMRYPALNDYSETAIAERRVIDSETRRLAESTDLFSVTWSTDGTHGIYSLKPDTNASGLSMSHFSYMLDPSGRYVVRNGRTFDGRPLAILQINFAKGSKRQLTFISKWL
jgi:hypothetical protein